MASTYGFTTAAIVKERLKNYNTDASDDQIDTMITHSEGLIIAVSKHKWTSKGSSTIPELIAGVTADLAALYLLANDPSGFTSNSET